MPSKYRFCEQWILIIFSSPAPQKTRVYSWGRNCVSSHTYMCHAQKMTKLFLFCCHNLYNGNELVWHFKTTKKQWYEIKLHYIMGQLYLGFFSYLNEATVEENMCFIHRVIFNWMLSILTQLYTQVIITV